MKVKDLIAALKDEDPELNVVIDDTRYGTIGASPSVGIHRVAAGFDWDHGKFILFPEKSMTTVDKETIKSMIVYANQAGWRGKYERQIAELTRQLEEIKK